MFSLVRKEISLSSSSCLSLEAEEGEKFVCEKAFEIMQLIDQQINKNDVQKSPHSLETILPKQELPDPVTLSKTEHDDIHRTTKNIQNFIKNL